MLGSTLPLNVWCLCWNGPDGPQHGGRLTYHQAIQARQRAGEGHWIEVVPLRVQHPDHGLGKLNWEGVRVVVDADNGLSYDADGWSEVTGFQLVREAADAR